MPSDRQEELEELARRLGAQGFSFRRAPYFAATGVFISSSPIQNDEFAVIEYTVFLYGVEERWEARVTQHGGPHWIRQAESLERLEEVALEALRSSARPPNDEWKVADEWEHHQGPRGTR
jgi:hypothetical protein